MQLKELTLKELLALFDTTTHEQISAYFEDPEIHYIVVFANHFQPDMGLLTVGPTQDCTSLEQAKRAIIDRKFAKFVLRCKNCPPERKKSETMIGLVRPIDRTAHLAAPKAASAPAPVEAPKPTLTRPPVSLPSPAAVAVSPEREAELNAREAELAKREAALKAIEAELKQREDELVEREEYVTQSEESLIDKIQLQERRAAELEQQEDNIRKREIQLTKLEAAAKAAAGDSPAA